MQQPAGARSSGQAGRAGRRQAGRQRKPLKSGSKAHEKQLKRLLEQLSLFVEAHGDCRLFLAVQSAYSQKCHIKSHNMAGARKRLQREFVEAAAAQGGRAVVAKLRAELRSYGTQGALAVQAALAVLEAEGHLGKQQADTLLNVLGDEPLDTEGKSGRQQSGASMHATLPGCMQSVPASQLTPTQF